MTISADERKAIVQIRIEKARAAMKAVENNVALADWYTSSNRLYYAGYYIVSALLIKNQYVAHTHSGVMSLFGLHFIKTEIVNAEMGRLYRKLFELRQEGDYNDYVLPSAEDILPLIEPTKAFIYEIERLLQA
jgi:uncharacterized protein (UPF0332 family)